MSDQPSSALDTIESLDPDWGLVLFAVIIVAVVIWLGLRYGDDAKK